MVGSLHRPADRNHGTARGHSSGQASDCRRVNLGYLGRPVGGLGHAVDISCEVVLEAFEPHTIAGEKRSVVKVFRGEGMHQSQHQGRVGVGPDRQPICVYGTTISPQWADANEFYASGAYLF